MSTPARPGHQRPPTITRSADVTVNVTRGSAARRRRTERRRILFHAAAAAVFLVICVVGYAVLVRRGIL